jgi:dynein heavy chain, axonemal
MADMQAYSKGLRDEWVKTWPGQVVLCISQIYWTSQVHSTLRDGTGIKKLWEELQVRAT